MIILITAGMMGVEEVRKGMWKGMWNWGSDELGVGWDEMRGEDSIN